MSILTCPNTLVPTDICKGFTEGHKASCECIFQAGFVATNCYKTYHVELTDLTAIRQSMYRYSAEKQNIIQEQVQELLADALM